MYTNTFALEPKELKDPEPLYCSTGRSTDVLYPNRLLYSRQTCEEASYIASGLILRSVERIFNAMDVVGHGSGGSNFRVSEFQMWGDRS